MEKICLDFDTSINFLKGDVATVEKLRYYVNREEICITSITLLQLLRAVKDISLVHNFSNSVTVLPLDKKAVFIAEKLRRELENEIPKSEDNLLVAAICIANNALLYTRSSWKFEGISMLRKI